MAMMLCVEEGLVEGLRGAFWHLGGVLCRMDRLLRGTEGYPTYLFWGGLKRCVVYTAVLVEVLNRSIFDLITQVVSTYRDGEHADVCMCVCVYTVR